MPITRKRCTKCSEEKPAGEFPRNSQAKSGLGSWCKTCVAINSMNYLNERRKDPAYRLWLSTKTSSITRKREHQITVEDIRSLMVLRCPYFGIKLTYQISYNRKRPFNAATVDRIDSSIGYVSGNVRIISWGANRLKSNLTDKQLVTLANSILRLHG